MFQSAKVSGSTSEVPSNIGLIMYQSFHNSLNNLANNLSYMYQVPLDKKAFDYCSDAWKAQAYLTYKRIEASKSLLGDKNTRQLIEYLKSQLYLLDSNLSLQQLVTEYNNIDKITEAITR